MSDSAREIVNTRLFGVSREALFEAWSNPKVLAKWWGPKGFTNTFHEFCFEPGGTWRYDMHAPNGTDFPNKSVFVEIKRPERLVLDHLEPVHKFRATATFEAVGDKTKLTFKMAFATAEEVSKLKNFIYHANEENFDRLEAAIR